MKLERRLFRGALARIRPPMSDDDESSVPIPKSRLGRLARFAAMGVRTGAGMVMNRDASPVAAHAAEVLGSLRGLAAKVGQMASYVDGLVPEQHADAFEASLKALR
ncbi:MAG: hypothetical protein ACRENE_23015, partial [Polyangiaceae bacterium]